VYDRRNDERRAQLADAGVQLFDEHEQSRLPAA
jgi:hypothetical protein